MVGGTQRFVATAKASDGTVIGGVDFTWSSSNPAVVTIDNAGVATAVSAGTAMIRATGNGIASAPATVTVAEPPPPTHTPDRDVLVALYEATGGPNWTHNMHWLSQRPVGEWYGVTTDATGRVTKLELQENGLTGVIPPEIGNLNDLHTLWLYGNELSGGIPAELGSLANLVRLSLHANRLTESIPAELGTLANLRRLFLSNNKLTGPIPRELGDLSNLEYLSLGNNYLEGAVPDELGRLVRLTYLWLYGNAFLSGPLPLTFTGLASLERLYVERTGLCAPDDDAFQMWLSQVPVKSVVFTCGSE